MKWLPSPFMDLMVDAIMKKQYVFSDKEYRSVLTSVSSAYHYMAKRLEENYDDYEARLYIDLDHAIDVLKGYIELEDDV